MHETGNVRLSIEMDESPVLLIYAGQPTVLAIERDFSGRKVNVRSYEYVINIPKVGP